MRHISEEVEVAVWVSIPSLFFLWAPGLGQCIVIYPDIVEDGVVFASCLCTSGFKAMSGKVVIAEDTHVLWVHSQNRIIAFISVIRTCRHLLCSCSKGDISVTVGVLDRQVVAFAGSETCEEGKEEYHQFFILHNESCGALPVFGTAIIFNRSFHPFLHLHIGEGNVGSCYCYFKDVCILVACLPLHIFCRNGGCRFLSVYGGADDVSALRCVTVSQWWNVIPFLSFCSLMIQISIFLVRNGEFDGLSSCFCSYPFIGSFGSCSCNRVADDDISLCR